MEPVRFVLAEEDEQSVPEVSKSGNTKDWLKEGVKELTVRAVDENELRVFVRCLNLGVWVRFIKFALSYTHTPSPLPLLLYLVPSSNSHPSNLLWVT